MPSLLPSPSRAPSLVRPSLWPLAVAAVLVAGSAACSPAPSGEAAPGDERSAPAASAVDLSGHNLLLITVDTLRADRLGVYGDTRAETPRLDALARRGVRFESAYSPVPLTLPAHSTLFTGRYPFTHGVRNNGNYFLRADEETLAEVLKRRGFHTRAWVASYILSAKFGLGQGFDAYDDALGSGELIRGFSSEIGADEVADRFVGWLGEGPATPFFAWLHVYDPHQPYRPPEPFLERFAGDPYRGEVAFVDAQVGVVLDALEARGLLAKTLIVVTSDHGEGFGEHGEVGHGILAYEEALKVPLIVAAPGLPPRLVSDRVRLVDLMPTLLDLLGLEPPPGLQGESFAALVTGSGEPGAERDVYFESMLGRDENNWAPLTGLIAGRYKYISLPERELYDLGEDPDETRNLFPEPRRVVRELDRGLRELLLSATGADASREASPEDLAHLEALGYLSAGGRTEQVIDPKRGIRLERALQEVREHLAAGRLEAAEAGLARLADDNRELGVGSYYFLEHQVRAAKGDEAGAIRALEAGMARFPESERFPFLLAHYQLGLGRHAEAERLARAVLEQSPKFSQAIILIGRAVAGQGRLAEALGHYRQALELEPQNLPLRLRLAEALARAGDAAAALALYDPLADAGALDGEPDELVKAAMLSAGLGRPERAEALFRRALAVAPSGMRHLGFAFVLARHGKVAEAVEELETALGDFGHELGPEQQRMARQALEQWRDAL